MSVIDTEALLHHGTFVRSVARSLVRDVHLADDLSQETWLAALRRPPRHPGNLRGWLAGVTRNLSKLHFRGETRRRAREEAGARPERVRDTSAVVERLDWERRIVEAVRELEEPYRSTIVYRFFEQMEPAAIARRMDVPRKTVYTRTERALERLRTRFDGEAGGRRAWALALLPLAFDKKPIVAGAAAAAAGGAAMTKTSVAVTAGLVAASFLAGWSFRPERAPPDRAVVTEMPVGEPDRTTVAAPKAEREETPERRGRVEEGSGLTSFFVHRVQIASPSFSGVIDVAHEISDMDPADGLAIMKAIFREVKSAEKRRQMLKAFTIDDGNLQSLEILHLGASDPDPGVRDWALAYLNGFGFRDFRAAPETYPPWRERHAGRPLRTVVYESAEEFVLRVTALSGDALKRELHTFETLTLQGSSGCNALELPGLMKRLGLLQVATRWLDDASLSPGERNIVHGWIRSLVPDEAYLRRVYLPALEDPSSADDFHAATRALGKGEHRWAVEPLVEAYARARNLGEYRAISRALRRIGDPRAVPAMISAIAADDTQATIEGVGESLARLVDEEYYASRDGAWWLAWWERNKERYPGLTLPAR
ncbi:MAG: sigma-70 family RNA polymerase sigma factor [Planctomycetota bacterium]|jgi:RNA polymerase sigma-70 factor (ECF subfamily)